MISLQEPLLPPGAAEVQRVSLDTDIENATNVRLLEDNSNTSDDFVVVDETTTITTATIDVDVDVDVAIIDESGWDHGQEQPKACRDWIWGFLFLVQFAVVLTVAVMGIRNMVKQGSEWLPGGGGKEVDRKAIWFLLSLVGSTIAVSSLLLNVLLGALAPMLIQTSLVLSPLAFFVTFVGSLITFNLPIALFSLIMSLIGTYYAFIVWHKVPFATANLKIALAAIKDNHGLWILAYAVTVKAYAWTFLWFSAVAELVIFSPTWVYDCTRNNSSSNEEVCHLSTQGKWIALGMLLSLFWTSQVLKNIFHTTIAGVVGTWWFDPEEARSASASANNGRNNGGCGLFGCCGCSRAIYDSWIRSSFNSFGSICFGSLLVGLLQVLQFIVRCGRQQRDQQRRQQRQRSITGTDFLCCLLQYVVDALESLVEYVNTWAFVYVGLYGYDYWTAGKQVSTLFQARGWSVIINDHLISRSLSMMSLLIGLVTGLVGVLLGLIFLGPLEAIPAFFLGAVLGGASCQILFGVVTSAVNTVVVCFAESPNQLRTNHDPELFRDLIQAWRKAYPQDCGF